MRSIRNILPIVLLVATGFAQAQNAVGGVGVATCDIWLDARKMPQKQEAALTEALIQTWVQGYLSGKNVHDLKVKIVLSVPDGKAINGVLDFECSRVPDATIYPIVDAYATRLRALYQRK